MSDSIIYPRSPHETMNGWVYLPRFIDKIRLNLAGKLHPDYQNNFTQGFDAVWLKAAGLTVEQFTTVVKNSVTDGEVCDWLRQNVQRTAAEKAEFNQYVLHRGNDADESRARLQSRKALAGISHRADVKTFVDLIEADEKRI